MKFFKEFIKPKNNRNEIPQVLFKEFEKHKSVFPEKEIIGTRKTKHGEGVLLFKMEDEDFLSLFLLSHRNKEIKTYNATVTIRKDYLTGSNYAYI